MNCKDFEGNIDLFACLFMLKLEKEGILLFKARYFNECEIFWTSIMPI